MSYNIAKRLCLALGILAMIGGCTDTPEKPDSLISEDKYISLLVEVQLVRSYSETGKIDSLQADSLRNEIFEKYAVPSTSFWESHEYYQQFPKQQKERIEKAIEELRMDRVTDTSQTNNKRPKN